MASMYYKPEMIAAFEDDFARYPPMDHNKYSLKYVKTELMAKLLHRRVTVAETEQARRQLTGYLRQYCQQHQEDFEEYQAGLEAIWPDMKRRMLAHPALYQYVMDFAVRSPTLLNFMSYVPCSETMENAFGYGYNIAGKYGPLPLDDVAFYWSLREPVLSGIRQRVYYAQDMIAKLMDPIMQDNRREPLRILMVGAGRMPELRRRSYPRFFFAHQEIVAVDEDKGVWSNLDDLFRYTHDCTTAEADIRYFNMSIGEFVRDQTWSGYFDLIVLQGVMSYYSDDVQTVHMLRDLRSMLKPGGLIVMDLQLFHISLLRCKFALDWNTNPPLSPDMSDKKAEKRIRAACETVGLHVDDVRLFRTDCREDSPKIGVAFTLRRPLNWAV